MECLGSSAAVWSAHVKTDRVARGVTEKRTQVMGCQRIGDIMVLIVCDAPGLRG